MIIGLSGYARSGKDTAAEALVAAGWTRVAFADVLREFLYKLNPVLDVYWDQVKAFADEERFEVRLRDEIDLHGWDGYKENSMYAVEIRGLLQRLGTECGRELISDNIWIDASLGRSQSDNIVVTDVRFPNEANAIEDQYDGRVIRIERPGIGPANSHPSETALDNHDFYTTITNDGTIEDLHRKLMDFVEEERHTLFL